MDLYTGGQLYHGQHPRQVESAYRISAKGYGDEHVRRYGWFDVEMPQKRLHIPGFRVMKTPVTQAEYGEFVRETGHPAPYVDKASWRSYGLIHPYSRVRQYLWKNQKHLQTGFVIPSC